LGVTLSSSKSIRFRLNPTIDGISFGPVIPGYDLHVTAIEKDGVFHSHLKYSEKGWKKPRYKHIKTVTREEMARFLEKVGVESISLLIEKYGETDEALVLTDVGKKVFRELLKGIITVYIRGRKLLFDVQLGHLIDREKLLQEKGPRLFKVGTVDDAFKNDLFGGPFVLSPDLKPILRVGNEIYIYKRSPLEIMEFIKSCDSRSVTELFSEMKKTELKPIFEYSEILGIQELFVELDRRNLLEKWFSGFTQPNCLV